MNILTRVTDAEAPQNKFQHPDITVAGEPRASVPLHKLETLWFNTGTVCNIECLNCYIASSPTNDRLVYLKTAEVTPISMRLRHKVTGRMKSGSRAANRL